MLSVVVSEMHIFPVSNCGCRSLLKSTRDTLFELAVVENLRFDVEILMKSIVISKI